MKELWNERFRASDYAYGTEPNTFLKENSAYFKAGDKVLFISKGEGRNSVFLAIQGAQVSAFDLSEEGRRKALALAEQGPQRGRAMDCKKAKRPGVKPGRCYFIQG